MGFAENENAVPAANDKAPAGDVSAAAGQNVTGMKASAAEVPWRKLHPLSPIARGGISFIIIFGVLFNFVREWLTDLLLHQAAPAAYLPGSDDTLETPGSGSWFINLVTGHGMVVSVILGIIVFCLLAVLASYLSWRAARFRITPSAVEETHGIFTKTHKRAPLERIQSVNLQRQLVVRLLGLASVEIHTAGQGGNLQLNYLSFRQAQALREEILDAVFRQRQARGQEEAAANAVTPVTAAAPAPATAATSASASEEEQTAPDNFAVRLGSHVDGIFDTDTDAEARASGMLLRVPTGRLLGSVVLSWTTVVVLLSTAAVFALFFWISQLEGSDFSALLLLPTLIPLFLGVFAVLYSQFNHGFNFTLSRAHDAVRVGSGLTSTQTETLPFGRIHALEASQPVLWRVFGWWQVRVVTAGHSLDAGTQSNGYMRNVVLPVGTAADVALVLQTVLPGVYQGQDAQPAHADTARLLRELSGTPTDFIPAAKNAWPVLLFGRKRAGMLLDTQAQLPSLRIRRGILTRRLAVLPLFRAQSVAYSTPLLHRLCGLGRITAHTVPGYVVLHMRGLARETAQQEFSRLAQAVLRAQLGEAKAERSSAERSA